MNPPAILILAITAGTLVAAPERVAFFSTGDRIPGTIDACEDSKVVISSPALAAPATRPGHIAAAIPREFYWR